MLYVLGYPSDLGGANVELYATIRLWRSHGVEVTLVPTWSAPEQWRERLDRLGCKTLITSDKRIELPDDSTVIAFGNYHLLDVARRLDNCQLICVPCTGKPERKDVKFHAEGGQFDRYIFQSCYQYMQWTDLLEKCEWMDLSGENADRCLLIPGAFDPCDFTFNPRRHAKGDPFWCGRISRPDRLKYSPQLWDAYRSVPNIRARIMAWSRPVEAHCGPPPDWATVLKKRTESSRVFYSHLHAIIHPSGKVSENWPRFVLEAMASGVPIITDNRGGVCEMIEHGQTGFLCDTLEDMAAIATRLAEDEEYRLKIAVRALSAVGRMSNADKIWKLWEPLIGGL